MSEWMIVVGLFIFAVLCYGLGFSVGFKSGADMIEELWDAEKRQQVKSDEEEAE